MNNALSRAVGLAAALWLCAPLARAEMIVIVWAGDGRFERSLSLAGGGFSELCGALKPGQSVSWSFESDQPLNVNIHYHEGKAVHYPVRAEQVRSRQGTLAVDAAQDYCWMWSNKSGADARLRVQLWLQ
jgi:hypothetical protein